jgi:hypothetical protein
MGRERGIRRIKSLRPAFIVTTAALAAACSTQDLSEFGPNSRDRDPDPNVISNPPPPDPVPPPRPDFGPTVTQAKSPPALGAATLVIAEDGRTAVVSDPDRDRVLIVDLASDAHPIRDVALAEDDEPGRLALDDHGHAHVVLRRAGAVASIDLTTGVVRERRAVCAAPQGIAIASSNSTLYITCAGGEIVELPAAAGGAASVLARVDRDLRDVVVQGDHLLVSRLRSAEVLRVAKADGTVIARSKPQHAANPTQPEPTEPFVGYRLAPTPTGALLVHQLGTTALVEVDKPQAYAGTNPCGGSVTTTVSTFETATDGAITGKIGALIGHGVLPVDLARTPDGHHLAVVAAGNGHTKELPQVHLLDASDTALEGHCSVNSLTFPQALPPDADPPGQAVAVAFTLDSASIAVFTREPAALHLRPVVSFGDSKVPWTTIALGGRSREDTGHAVFHSNTGGGIACVSCHPGGADDGRVWKLSTGERRTQSLQGTLDGMAPYHWGGDAPGIETFATDVFVKKMGGQDLVTDQVDALRSWLVRIPAPRVSAAVDPASSTRGKALFENEEVGCNGCHSGPKHSNNTSADVGTGGVYQVPSLLGLATRAPYLHDGRARSLADRVGLGGEREGVRHGNTTALTTAEFQDLIAYLETL